ncbi:MAG: sulfatase-like hydrolase/transferase [Planctomycetes bacterium]|nr:sulfatase-like hydrolase/transferase [Planctomycetota bacterium]
MSAPSMTRRDFLATLAGGAAAAAWPRRVAAAAPAARLPNFIIILADDLGAKELGCYGQREYKTPNLDRLAAEGMRFETCYAEPLCSPTRVALMTGQYGFRTGYFNLMGRPYVPKPDSPEYDVGAKVIFSDLLKTRGYATALSGKWQLPGKVPTLIHDCGFDEYRMWAYAHNLPPGVTHTGAFEDAGKKKPARYWNPCIMENGKYIPTTANDYGPDLFNGFVIDFLRRHKQEPFCVYYTSPLTHAPYDPTPDPNNPGNKWPKGFKSNLEYLDVLMGRLVKAVDDLGLGEQTVILFVGDNGTGSQGKGQVSELGARVPLIVRWPGTVAAGTVSRELADVSDVFPTVAELAGARIPDGLVIDGVSLAPTLRGGKEEHRPWIFSFLGQGRVLRDKRWLLESPGPGKERFFDCGDRRDGTGYRNVTGSTDPEVVAARKRFDEILKNLPGPDGHPGLTLPGPDEQGAKANQKAGKGGKKAAGDGGADGQGRRRRTQGGAAAAEPAPE